MQALLNKDQEGLTDKAVGVKELRIYVHLIDGTCREVEPADVVRLTQEDVLFFRDSLVVAAVPRNLVYFATRQPVSAPPVLF